MGDDDPTSDAADEPERAPETPSVRWPFLAEVRPRSVRLPWSRSVLGALWTLLLPLVWVAETSSCGSGTTRERTGLDLVSEIGSEPGDSGPIVLAVVLCLAVPWLAAAMVGAGRRLALTLVGALASLATSVFSLAILALTIFGTRTIRPVGYVILCVSFAIAIDGLVRLGFGFHEWLLARRARAAAKPEMSAEPETPQG